MKKIVFLKDADGQIEGEYKVTHFVQGGVYEVGVDIDVDLANVFVNELEVAEHADHEGIDFKEGENKLVKTTENKVKRTRRKKVK